MIIKNVINLVLLYHPMSNIPPHLKFLKASQQLKNMLSHKCKKIPFLMNHTNLLTSHNHEYHPTPELPPSPFTIVLWPPLPPPHYITAINLLHCQWYGILVYHQPHDKCDINPGTGDMSIAKFTVTWHLPAQQNKSSTDPAISGQWFLIPCTQTSPLPSSPAKNTTPNTRQ